MSELNETIGIVLLCDATGRIVEIVRNNFPAINYLQSGERLIDFIDKASVEKAQNFLFELKNQQAAFNWELNVRCQNNQVQSLHFAGGAFDEKFVVIGAQSRAGVNSFYNDLVAINNEQTNHLRRAMKDLSLNIKEQTDRDNHYYDELSRLNNELATRERELAKKNVELQKLNEQKNQFLGFAAHDLRNPLEVIATYSQFLLEDAAPALEAEQIEFIHIIRESSSFMLALVNDFLDVAKIEAGRLELDLATVDLPALTRQNVERNQIIADKKEIKIRFDSAEDVPPLQLDEPKIEQVLNNLIGNAVKFSPPGSTVAVSLDIEEADEQVVISIKDSGPGIAQDEQNKLFDLFVKGRARGTAGEKNTGLGLAIVKKIIEKHGGLVSVESELGQNSIFKVRLPV